MALPSHAPASDGPSDLHAHASPGIPAPIFLDVPAQQRLIVELVAAVDDPTLEFGVTVHDACTHELIGWLDRCTFPPRIEVPPSPHARQLVVRAAQWGRSQQPWFSGQTWFLAPLLAPGQLSTKAVAVMPLHLAAQPTAVLNDDIVRTWQRWQLCLGRPADGADEPAHAAPVGWLHIIHLAHEPQSAERTR